MEVDSRKLFVWAKVIIDKKSPYWRSNYNTNPKGAIGVVTNLIEIGLSEDDPESWWHVEWANGENNAYQHGDLKVLGKVVDV